MRKKTAGFCLGMLLGLIVIAIISTPLHLFDPKIWGGLFVPQQEVPNAVPPVIPSLHAWQGGYGSFTMRSTSHIVIDPTYSSQLKDTATVFQTDLAAVTGHMLSVVTKSTPATGDFFLTLNNPDPTLPNEGYLFQVDDAVSITADTPTGVFYGTRTALQILLQDDTKTHIPRGSARDYPQYAERGFMLDAGRKFFPLSQLEDYVKLMGWYKMNDFHIHFNDNAIGGGDSADWMHQYAAFRLNSPRFPGLAAKDGSYTRQDISALQTVAKEYGVTITPEIDAPAHDLAFTQYRPDLAIPNASKELLDLSNPNTYTFLNAIWNEFLPWFDSKQVDIGADEYTPSDATLYREFVNTYNTFLRSKGKTVRMWGSLSEMPSNIKVNTNITIDDWNNGWSNPLAMADLGYSLINANDSLLYIVPKAGYYNDYLNTQLLYEHWEPNIFSLADPGLNLQQNDPHLLGGMFSVWNDRLGSVVTDADVYMRVKPAMQTLSQKLWSNTTVMPYDEFSPLAQFIGDAPATHPPE